MARVHSQQPTLRIGSDHTLLQLPDNRIFDAIRRMATVKFTNVPHGSMPVLELAKTRKGAGVRRSGVLLLPGKFRVGFARVGIKTCR